MNPTEIYSKLAHEKWVQSRSLAGLNRIRSATYNAFNVLRNRYPVNKFRNEIKPKQHTFLFKTKKVRDEICRSTVDTWYI